MAPRLAWGSIACSALAGTLVAFTALAQVLVGSDTSVLEIFQFRVAASIAIIGGTGALAGALISLPGALPQRIVHRSLGLWILVAFGNVDWLGTLDGQARTLGQLALLIAIVAAARMFKHADARMGLVALTIIAGWALAPIGILVWRDAGTAFEARWRFEDAELANRLMASASASRERGHSVPDLYLVVTDRYPSLAEAERRGYPYPAHMLAQLRARGWRIRSDAVSSMPVTALTLAATWALTNTISDGARVQTGSKRLKALYEADRLRWSETFAQPLLLDVLGQAGYETHGWIGWWLPTYAIPFDYVDSSRGVRRSNTLIEAVGAMWLWTHLGWVKHSEHGHLGHVARSTQPNCRELVRQRERFFAQDGTRRATDPPRFVFYHVFWLHDMVNMDTDGECADAEEDAAFEVPYGLSDWRIALCRNAKAKGAERTHWVPGCLPDAIRARRRAAMIAYLPVFLERLEVHAKRNAGTRGFRILVFSDEGISDPHRSAERDPAAWWDTHWRKHPAVLRATLAGNVPALWAPETIPDMPQAVREVVEQTLDDYR